MAKGYKTGGRQKGTPNKKENSITALLRTHSEEYFTPRQQTDEDGKTFIASDFDVHLGLLAPDDRVSAEIRILEFHTPKKKAVEVDLDASVNSPQIEDILRSLCDPV